jgi:hypothetical protein
MIGDIVPIISVLKTAVHPENKENQVCDDQHKHRLVESEKKVRVVLIVLSP